MNVEMIIIFTLFVGSFLLAIRGSINKYGAAIPTASLREFGVINYTGTKWQIILSVVGTSLGGAITIGFIGLIYRSGVVFYIAGLSFLIGLVMLYAMIPRIRAEAKSKKYISIEQYMSGDSRLLNILVSIVNIFAFMGLLVSQVISIKLIIFLRFPQYADVLVPRLISSVHNFGNLASKNEAAVRQPWPKVLCS